MKYVIPTAILLMILMPAATLMAATRYGEAKIVEGKMTVLRDGKRLRYKAADGSAAINVKDVIRVGRNSKVILETNEKATVTLGSRAVMQVEPWKAKQNTGTFRMLFGRVRAKIVGLTGGERFNMKSATATIGVKGSGFDNTTNAQGITVSSCTEHECIVVGTDGLERIVPAGYVIVALITGTTPPLPDPGLDTNLDADPNDAGDEVVDAGIVSQDDLDESNNTDVNIDDDVSGPGGDDSGGDTDEDIIINEPTFNLEDAVQAGQELKVDINVQFEK